MPQDGTGNMHRVVWDGGEAACPAVCWGSSDTAEKVQINEETRMRKRHAPLLQPPSEQPP